VEIAHIAYRSDQIDQGGLFCAWRGERFDGHRFIQDALARGAAAVVVEDADMASQAPIVIEVESGRHALARAAANFYRRPDRSLRLAGITGTNGKTSVAYLMHRLLDKAGVCAGMVGTIEYRVGGEREPAGRTTPESLDLQRLFARMRDAQCGAAVLEVSSHALAQGRVEDILFEAAVFTNLTPDHLDFHGDMEHYLAAKSILFSELREGAAAVVNVDDPSAERIEAVAGSGARKIRFGLSAKADYRAEELRCHRQGSAFDFVWPGGRHRVELPWVGAHNVSNALAAASATIAMGLSPEFVAEGLKDAPAVPGRLERVLSDRPFTVLVDYAHTPDALRKVLEALRPLTEGRLRVLAGCGGDRDRSKRPNMALACCACADAVVFTTDNPRSEEPKAILADMTAGVFNYKNFEVIEDRAEAIARIIDSGRAGDVVVLAGKGHEETQEIKGARYPFSDRTIAAGCLQGGWR
jgi:UDP-N-acetylmuramoyl-L-alanyl-D-glutamate--2,6-diaminopimelate ligase